ncbi:hypothetical protein G6N76_11065 [Rhizobium daejeonense]|uniref:Uncharacterized protein n=1 Tax=Rhizobium daejeonense TaxID=240521 RepID=A0A6M1S783_9HYPH|nr:hypothetical protein [Rhizobium daejeonense]NGO64218.1 hypothetical protein [Rhizobium daejeonense]
MKDKSRILLVIAPSFNECRRTAMEFDLDFDKVERMRFLHRVPQLRGWTRGTPFIALRRDHWPEALDSTLHAMQVKGQLRIATDRDLADLVKAGTAVATAAMAGRGA